MNIKINYLYLCSKHHKEKNSPHGNSLIDLEYKLELQEQLFYLFRKQYYSFEEIQDILETSKSITKKVVKNLRHYKNGYKSHDIVKALMGGKIYQNNLKKS